jgi:hypothetical protein
MNMMFYPLDADVAERIAKAGPDELVPVTMEELQAIRVVEYRTESVTNALRWNGDVLEQAWEFTVRKGHEIVGGGHEWRPVPKVGQ